MMANEFDPYREALVVEQVTIWPDDGYGLDRQNRQKVEAALHSHPKSATELTYVRLPTGFCRRIRVTPEDITQILGTGPLPPQHNQTLLEKHHG